MVFAQAVHGDIAHDDHFIVIFIKDCIGYDVCKLVGWTTHHVIALRTPLSSRAKRVRIAAAYYAVRRVLDPLRGIPKWS